MNKAVLAVLLLSALLIASSPGIRPRADTQSYPAHHDQENYSIGAAVVPPDQVKKMFKLDLSHGGYVEVEVGIYRNPGKDMDLYPTDFTLNIGNQYMGARPTAADTVAELAIGKAPPAIASSPHDINTSVGAAIGHGTYVDPATGRRTSGTYSDTEVEGALAVQHLNPAVHTIAIRTRCPFLPSASPLQPKREYHCPRPLGEITS